MGRHSGIIIGTDGIGCYGEEMGPIAAAFERWSSDAISPKVEETALVNIGSLDGAVACALLLAGVDAMIVFTILHTKAAPAVHERRGILLESSPVGLTFRSFEKLCVAALGVAATLTEDSRGLMGTTTCCGR